jgi:hypothetical protein
MPDERLTFVLGEANTEAVASAKRMATEAINFCIMWSFRNYFKGRLLMGSYEHAPLSSLTSVVACEGARFAAQHPSSVTTHAIVRNGTESNLYQPV